MFGSRLFDKESLLILREAVLKRIQNRLKPMHPPDYPISELICDDMMEIIKYAAKKKDSIMDRFTRALSWWFTATKAKMVSPTTLEDCVDELKRHAYADREAVLGSLTEEERQILSTERLGNAAGVVLLSARLVRVQENMHLEIAKTFGLQTISGLSEDEARQWVNRAFRKSLSEPLVTETPK